MSENERDEEGRRKLRLLLTPSEFGELEAAVLETGVTRSLLVLEAIQAGLSNHNLKITEEKRSRIIYTRMPSEVKEKLQALAAKFKVTQQHLLRHLLFTYLSATPWRPTPRQRKPQPNENRGDPDAR